MFFSHLSDIHVTRACTSGVLWCTKLGGMCILSPRSCIRLFFCLRRYKFKAWGLGPRFEAVIQNGSDLWRCARPVSTGAITELLSPKRKLLSRQQACTFAVAAHTTDSVCFRQAQICFHVILRARNEVVVDPATAMPHPFAFSR
jgi:hypothetical protein